MKVLKIIGFVLLALVGLFLLMGVIAPKEISTERSIVIDATPATVYGVVNDLATWDKWSPWKENDPTIATTLGEKTVGVGATSSWTSEKSGAGQTSITSSEPGKKVGVEVAFQGMGVAQSPFTLEPTDGRTRTTWSFYTKVPFPWNAFNLLGPGAEAIEKDYDRGLQLLKEYVESTAAEAITYQVKEEELPARYFAAIRNVISLDEVQQTYARDFGRLMQSCQTKGIEPAGMPCGAYYNWDESTGKTDMASCIPVKEKADLGEGIEIIEIPAGKALVVDYYGPYEQIGAAHEAIDQYLVANELTPRLPIYEEYVTDPGTEPDPQKWLTRVCYPLE